MVMSLRYAVPYDDEIFPPVPRRQARLLDGAVGVLRVIADPCWSAFGSLVAAGTGAAWMMVMLLKHVPLVL
jgi:hypothetical protein